MAETAEKYLARRSVPEPTTGCWLWEGSVNSAGYGTLTRNYDSWTAHVLSYVAHHGRVPAGHVVRHRCDQRLCVNPDHLVSGTPGDNTADAIRRGRVRGFNPGEVRYLRKQWRAGKDMSSLAREWGCDRASMSRLVRGLTYREVT